MMQRTRALKAWGRHPRRPGPTWRTALSLVVVAGVLCLLLEGWWILSVPGPLRFTSRVVEVPAHKGIIEMAEFPPLPGMPEGTVIRALISTVREIGNRDPSRSTAHLCTERTPKLTGPLPRYSE